MQIFSQVNLHEGKAALKLIGPLLQGNVPRDQRHQALRFKILLAMKHSNIYPFKELKVYGLCRVFLFLFFV